MGIENSNNAENSAEQRTADVLNEYGLENNYQAANDLRMAVGAESDVDMGNAPDYMTSGNDFVNNHMDVALYSATNDSDETRQELTRLFTSLVALDSDADTIAAAKARIEELQNSARVQQFLAVLKLMKDYNLEEKGGRLEIGAKISGEVEVAEEALKKREVVKETVERLDNEVLDARGEYIKSYVDYLDAQGVGRASSEDINRLSTELGNKGLLDKFCDMLGYGGEAAQNSLTEDDKARLQAALDECSSWLPDCISKSWSRNEADLAQEKIKNDDLMKKRGELAYALVRQKYADVVVYMEGLPDGDEKDKISDAFTDVHNALLRDEKVNKMLDAKVQKINSVKSGEGAVSVGLEALEGGQIDFYKIEDSGVLDNLGDLVNDYQAYLKGDLEFRDNGGVERRGDDAEVSDNPLVLAMTGEVLTQEEAENAFQAGKEASQEFGTKMGEYKAFCIKNGITLPDGATVSEEAAVSDMQKGIEGKRDEYNKVWREKYAETQKLSDVAKAKLAQINELEKANGVNPDKIERQIAELKVEMEKDLVKFDKVSDELDSLNADSNATDADKLAKKDEAKAISDSAAEKKAQIEKLEEEHAAVMKKPYEGSPAERDKIERQIAELKVEMEKDLVKLKKVSDECDEAEAKFNNFGEKATAIAADFAEISEKINKFTEAKEKSDNTVIMEFLQGDGLYDYLASDGEKKYLPEGITEEDVQDYMKNVLGYRQNVLGVLRDGDKVEFGGRIKQGDSDQANILELESLRRSINANVQNGKKVLDKKHREDAVAEISDEIAKDAVSIGLGGELSSDDIRNSMDKMMAKGAENQKFILAGMTNNKLKKGFSVESMTEGGFGKMVQSAAVLAMLVGGGYLAIRAITGSSGDSFGKRVLLGALGAGLVGGSALEAFNIGNNGKMGSVDMVQNMIDGTNTRIQDTMKFAQGLGLGEEGMDQLSSLKVNGSVPDGRGLPSIDMLVGDGSALPSKQAVELLADAGMYNLVEVAAKDPIGFQDLLLNLRDIGNRKDEYSGAGKVVGAIFSDANPVESLKTAVWSERYEDTEQPRALVDKFAFHKNQEDVAKAKAVLRDKMPEWYGNESRDVAAQAVAGDGRAAI